MHESMLQQNIIFFISQPKYIILWILKNCLMINETVHLGTQKKCFDWDEIIHKFMLEEITKYVNVRGGFKGSLCKLSSSGHTYIKETMVHYLHKHHKAKPMPL